MRKHNAMLTPLIFGTDKAEHIYGLGGDDIIEAGGRNDTIEGGADWMWGGRLGRFRCGAANDTEERMAA